MEESSPRDCIICGYSLQGLDPGGACPECGTPIERSLHGDYLRYSDQEWLGTIWRGARIVHVSLLTLFVTLLIAIGVTLALVIGASVSKFALDSIVGVIRMPVSLVICLAPVAIAIGLWWMSTPEPRLAARKTVRPTFFRILSIAVIPAIATMIVLNPRAPSIVVPLWFAHTFIWIAFLVIVAHSTMFIDFLQSLDRRCAQINEKRRKLLSKYRSQGLGCAAVVALASLLTLFVPGISTMFSVMILIWFAVVSFTRGTMRGITQECELAKNPVPATPAALS